MSPRDPTHSFIKSAMLPATLEGQDNEGDMEHHLSLPEEQHS